MRDVAEVELDGRDHPLDRRIRVVWAVQASILWFVLGVVGMFVGGALGNATVATVSIVAGVVLGLAGIIGAHLRWTCFRWSAWDDAIDLRHGVISRRESLVPYHRIQQIDVHRGPIERMVGLSTLVLRTAAATTDAELPGIAAEHAEQLRHRLLTRAGLDDAV